MVDPLTVKVTTKAPWVDVPRLLYRDGRPGSWRPAQLDNPDTARRNLIGTGPFKLDHWTVNQELVVNKNPDYWQKDAKGNQLPYLDKITFMPIPDAEPARELAQGRPARRDAHVDGQQIDAARPAGEPVQPACRRSRGRREIRYYLMNAAKAPFDDPNARLAVAYAIDRNQINQIRNNGVYTIADRPFDTKVPGYLKNPGFPKFNLKKATELANAYKAAHGGAVQRRARAHQRPREQRRGAAHQAAARQGRDRRHARSRRTRPRSSTARSAGTSASCCGATTPATTPTRSTCGGTRASP